MSSDHHSISENQGRCPKSEPIEKLALRKTQEITAKNLRDYSETQEIIAKYCRIIGRDYRKELKRNWDEKLEQ